MKTLVIGGTGMLAGTVHTLLDGGDDVFVLARHAPTFTHSRLHPLTVDYCDSDGLKATLAPHAPFDRAVVWIHGTAPDAPFLVAELVHGPFFHVLGSAAGDPSSPDPTRREQLRALGGDYHEVILGFHLTPYGSRWLTDEEISAGVWHAIQQGKPQHIVGTVTPWSARP